MLKFAPLNIKENFKNIFSLIESNEKNSLFEILSQDNIIQSINVPNTKISQYLFNHISDLFDIAIDIKFKAPKENQIKKDEIIGHESTNDHKIESTNSKIEYKDYNFYKISSNAREALVTLSINSPAQFSENCTFHEKMNHILDIINNQEKKSNLNSISENKILKTNVELNENANSSNEISQIINSKVDIDLNIAVVLISRIIHSLGKSENYSILASLSDYHDFFPKFCALLGTHCAVYDTLFTLSNDDMPAVSLFFEDMDTTELLLEIMKKSVSTIKFLSNDKYKEDAKINNGELFLNNYNAFFNYNNLDDIFRMQKRALVIITHLISNAEKESILIKNLSEKYEYMNFIYEDLGLNSLSNEVAASSFSLLIRLYQISLNPNVVNKSSLFNPFMNTKVSSICKQSDSDYDDYDLDYDSDYDSSENFNKITKKKCNQHKENRKEPKKIPPVKLFFESKFESLCKYVIDSKSFSLSTEKALEMLCLLLHIPEIQSSYFDQSNETNILCTMIEKLANDFFNYPNCTILHTNFRKLFSLVIKIEEQRKIDSMQNAKPSFVIILCNYLKEKIVQILISQEANNSLLLSCHHIAKDHSNTNENVIKNQDNCANEIIQNETYIQNIIDSNCKSKIEKSKDSNEKIGIQKENSMYSNYVRYDFSKYCFWGIVVELAELISTTYAPNSNICDDNPYWNKFILNDAERFRYITSHEYGGPIPQSTRTYGKILCVRSPSSSEPKTKSIFTNKVPEKLDFGKDSEDE